MRSIIYASVLFRVFRVSGFLLALLLSGLILFGHARGILDDGNDLFDRAFDCARHRRRDNFAGDLLQLLADRRLTLPGRLLAGFFAPAFLGALFSCRARRFL